MLGTSIVTMLVGIMPSKCYAQKWMDITVECTMPGTTYQNDRFEHKFSSLYKRVQNVKHG